VNTVNMEAVRWRKSSYSGGDGGECVEVAELWRKSSHSGGDGGQCIEVAELWRKSSHSGGGGGECVEIANLFPTIAIRDSKDPDGPRLALDRAVFAAFVQTVRSGGHDL
jgi:Domain of unknown function (DUF397)